MDPSLPPGHEAPLVKLETRGAAWASGRTLPLCWAGCPCAPFPPRLLDLSQFTVVDLSQWTGVQIIGTKKREENSHEADTPFQR